MKLRISVLAFILLQCLPLYGQNLDTLRGIIFFGYGEDTLSAANKEVLWGITGGYNVIQIEIFTKGGSVADKGFDLKWNERRANAVKDFFIQCGYHWAIVKIKTDEKGSLPITSQEGQKNQIDILMISQDLREKMPTGEEIPILKSSGKND